MQVLTDEFDYDYTAYYIDPSFTVGTDGEPENQRQVTIVIRMTDTEEYEAVERNTLIDVLVVPATLGDYGKSRLSGFMDAHTELDKPDCVAEACVYEGHYAHVTDFAMGISFDGTSLKEVWEADDWDKTVAWIKQRGEKLVSTVAGLIGFALDRQQNQIGETGWDWLMPLMYDDYESETMFIHRKRA